MGIAQYLSCFPRMQHATVQTLQIAQNLGDLYAESGQTLQGSFSVVSKPNSGSKYSLESSRRDLHNALLCTVLESIGEKWGKKGPGQNNPEKEENEKTRAQ